MAKKKQLENPDDKEKQEPEKVVAISVAEWFQHTSEFANVHKLFISAVLASYAAVALTSFYLGERFSSKVESDSISTDRGDVNLREELSRFSDATSSKLDRQSFVATSLVKNMLANDDLNEATMQRLLLGVFINAEGEEGELTRNGKALRRVIQDNFHVERQQWYPVGSKSKRGAIFTENLDDHIICEILKIIDDYTALDFAAITNAEFREDFDFAVHIGIERADVDPSSTRFTENIDLMLTGCSRSGELKREFFR